jgi:hypothetical protein
MSPGRIALWIVGAVGAPAMVLACGGGGSSEPEASTFGDTSDAGDGTSDRSQVYPAFPVDLPHILSNNGTVLKAPSLVTVTWPSQDTNSATWEAFGDAIGSSSYWSATTAEYGVGALTSGPSKHLHLTTPLPSVMSYYELESFVAQALGGQTPDGGAPSGDAGDEADDVDGAVSDGDSAAMDGTTDDSSGGGVADIDGATPDSSGAPSSTPDAAAPTLWPAPTFQSGNAQTIYSLFVPASVAVTDPGSGMSFCAEGGFGFHDNVIVGGTPVPYAVTLECSSQTVAFEEETAAHEYVEAATDPYPSSTNLGYVRFDPDHYAWEIYTGFNDELADACQNWASSFFQESGTFPYWVQSVWSNARAAAGHDPCVPNSGLPYQGITLLPSQQSTVTIDLTSIGMSKVTTQGFNAPIGQTFTFEVGFYSDAPTSAPWTISYDFPPEMQLFDRAGLPLGNGAATVTIDSISGQNGDMTYVHVTPTKTGTLGFQIMAITWDPPAPTSPYAPHYIPILIVNQ